MFSTRLLLRTTPALLASLLLIAACSNSRSTEQPDPDPTEQTQTGADGTENNEKPRFGTFGFDTDGMDRTVHPGDDFYRFASGTWDNTEVIPADRARYGVFDMLSLEAEEDVEALISDATKIGGPEGSNNQLIAALFQSWMDADTIEARGLTPITPYLDEIQALSDHDDIAEYMARFYTPSLYGVWISADPDNPQVHALRAYQSGLGMPNRDYYLDDAPRFAEYRTAYLAYITELFRLANIDNASDHARAILDFETQIAEGHWTRERSRQVEETYNVLALNEYDALSPHLRLAQGLQTLGLPPDVDKIIVSQPSAITAAGDAFKATDLDTLKAYLTFHFLSDRASWLPAAFDQARFDFFSKTLRGTEEMRPRDRRGIQLVGSSLGHAVGQEYVDRHFPPESKTQMDALVQNLTTAFRGRLEALDWMDDETRQQALAKLATFEPRIGYPEIWDSFEGLDLQPDDYFGNRMRLSEHRWNERLQRFPEPVDRRRWGWPPQIVNASYSPLMNQITFPAGILQAPFFDPHADPAINYGAIGGVIGHEIGHGFDDQGRRYDADGRIRDWWTDTTNDRFEEASSRLGDQYSQFCPIDDLCVNGRLSMGENIGDLGGLQMAYAAWRNFADQTYENGEAPIIDGFTGDQRFFLAWAQVWRSLYRDDALRAQLVNGPHSPGYYRVNGVVRNLDAWYDAFNVSEEHALYLPPDERVSIW